MDDPIHQIENMSVDFKPVQEELIGARTEQERLRKLQNMRVSIMKQEEIDKEKRMKSKKPKEDYYSTKLKRFLTSSFLVNMAIEPFFLYELTYDYIVSYLDMSENNLAFYPKTSLMIAFCFFKVIGLIIGHHIWPYIKEEENMAQKAFTSLILFTAISMYISTYALTAGYFLIFILLFCGLPGLFMGPITLFYMVNISRLAAHNRLSPELIFSYPCFAQLANFLLIPAISTLSINPDNIRPSLVNMFGGERSFLQPVFFDLVDVENRLIFAPFYVVVVGFTGLLTLYGVDWRAKEIPTEEIRWESLQKRKLREKEESKISLNAIKLADLMEFLDGKDESQEYTLRSMKSGEDYFGGNANTNKSGGTPGKLRRKVSRDSDDSKMSNNLAKSTSGKSKYSKISKKRSESEISKRIKGLGLKLGEKNLDPEKLYVTLREERQVNLISVLLSMPSLYLLLSFTFINTACYYYCLRTRSTQLTYLYRDHKTIPLMMTEAVGCAVLTVITVLVNYYTKQKKVALLFLNGLSLASVLLFPFFITSLYGMVSLTIISNYLYVNSQILMTVILAECVHHSLITLIFPFIYSSRLFSFLIIFGFESTFFTRMSSFTIVFSLLQVIGAIFVLGIQQDSFKGLVNDFKRCREKKAIKKEA